MDICLAEFLPSGGVNDLDYDSRLCIQVSKYFSVTALIVLLVFCSIVLLMSTFLIAIFSM